MKKRYLGDAVYADVDNGDVILTTEDGIKETNKIYLEPQVLSALKNFLEDFAREQGIRL